MRQRSVQLQSVCFALDGRSHANATESEDASLGSDHPVGSGCGIVVLRDEHEFVWDKMVCGWMGWYERLGAADGSIRHDSRLVGQRNGTSLGCAGELGCQPNL